MRFTISVTLGKANSSESQFYYLCNVDNDAWCLRLLENLNEILYLGLLEQCLAHAVAEPASVHKVLKIPVWGLRVGESRGKPCRRLPCSQCPVSLEGSLSSELTDCLSWRLRNFHSLLSFGLQEFYLCKTHCYWGRIPDFGNRFSDGNTLLIFGSLPINKRSSK